MKKSKEANEDTTKRDRESKSSDVPGPPNSRKRVNVIIGGNPICYDSIRVLKGYGRQVNSIPTKAKEMVKDDTIIEYKN